MKARDLSGKRLRGRPPRVPITWALLTVCVAILVGRGLVVFLVAGDGPMDLVLAIAIATLVAIVVVNTRISGMEGERLHSEAESFTSIVRALSRSLSPDAVVESIVHELGAATEADHVAVVTLRPGSSVLDVTFVSMLPGAPTSNIAMPLRQLDGVEARRSRDVSTIRRDDPERRRPADDEPIDPGRAGQQAAPDRRAASSQLLDVRLRSRAPAAGHDEAGAREVADRIAHRLRDAYGLRNTLAAPLPAGRSIAGAIVLSRRTDGVWPDAAVRLLNSAAAEASAALARVYSYQAAESEARTDQLTQLPNRRYFDEYCRFLASRCRSTDRVAIIAVDVDHFKNVNDLYGHQVGDLVLRAIANAIQLSVREEDVAVRFGGEEFTVLLRNPSRRYALEIGERVRQNVRNLDLIEAGVTERVTVSVGVASGEEAGEPIEEVVERADRALYSAKRSGRDRVVEAWKSAASR